MALVQSGGFPSWGAPTLTLPRKRERGLSTAAARGSTRPGLLPLPLAGEGRGGGFSPHDEKAQCAHGMCQ